MKTSTFFIYASFVFQVVLAVVDLALNNPQYSFPFNMGWVIMIGLLTIIEQLKDKQL